MAGRRYLASIPLAIADRSGAAGAELTAAYPEGVLLVAVLEILDEGPRSAGDVTRRLVATKKLPSNGPADRVPYFVTSDILNDLLQRGKVSKSGNGKSVHWKLVRP